MPTTKIEVRAVDSAGYDAVRRCLSLGIGTGIRKRHPRLSTIGTPNNNLPVRMGDTVNLVDVDTTAYDDDQMESWQPDRTAAQRQPNFIRFVYDTRSREVRVVIRSTAFIVGSCNETSFRDFLVRNGIHRTEEDDDEVYRGMMIEYDDSVFQISTISVSRNEVIMFELPQLGKRTLTRTTSWCVAHEA